MINAQHPHTSARLSIVAWRYLISAWHFLETWEVKWTDMVTSSKGRQNQSYVKV
jgi:hypothetical protein